MATRKTTIHDIALKLNLTASTVSRALNNHPKISTSTKELVRNTAEAMNYKPNTLAASLRTGIAKTIGLVVPRINRDFISNTIYGIEQVTKEAGYNLIIFQSDESLERELLGLKTLVNSRVDGILISISRETNVSHHLENLLKDGIPLVQFDRVREDVNTSKVVNDNMGAAFEAVSHLINQGCRRIVHFSGPNDINIYNERQKGYCKALTDNKIKIEKELLFEGVITREKGFEIAKELFSSSKLPDALFADSDYSALGALLVARELKLRVPEQLKIVGFANEPFTEFITPTITTLDQKAQEIGAEAAKLLINEIENKGKKLNRKKIIIKPSLLIRQSSQNNL